MNKKSPHKNNKAGPPSSPNWLPIIAGGAVLLIVIGLAVWWSSATSAPATGSQQAGSSPRLVVDRTTIDDGYVKFETPIEATFKLSNTGQQPLQILGEPQVELIEGC